MRRQSAVRKPLVAPITRELKPWTIHLLGYAVSLKQVSKALAVAALVCLFHLSVCSLADQRAAAIHRLKTNVNDLSWTNLRLQQQLIKRKQSLRDQYQALNLSPLPQKTIVVPEAATGSASARAVSKNALAGAGRAHQSETANNSTSDSQSRQTIAAQTVTLTLFPQLGRLSARRIETDAR